MRRIALVLLLIMLMGIGVAHAEITKGTDSFNGGTTINSGVSTADPSELDQIVFRKYVNANPIEYEIWANRVTSKDFIFSNTFLEIKVDDNPIHKIAIKGSGIISLADDYKQYSHVSVAVSADLIEQIKNAKRIAIRFQTATGVPYVYLLPDSVLAEWKEVINYQK